MTVTNPAPPTGESSRPEVAAAQPGSGPVTSPGKRCSGPGPAPAWARCCTRWKTTGSSTCR
jgi:hypothetical protein